MRQTLVLRAFCAVLPLVAAVSAAGERPDIAGVWQIDPAASHLGPAPVPQDLVLEITTKGDEFVVRQTGGGQPELTLTFNAAGKEAENFLPNGRMISVHRWEGRDLVAQIRILADDGSRMTFTDRISYSADGTVMTMKREISGSFAEEPMQVTIVARRK